jgi:acetyltransferase-like isoleucine patch superfamily enzyme
MNYTIHPDSDVQSVNIGNGTRIWQYVVILPDYHIGANCSIYSHFFIENNFIIGNGVTVKSGGRLWDGVHFEDYVFIAQNVTFTNDRFPRSKQYRNPFLFTTVKVGASIGGVTILPSLNIGRGSMVGAGAVVTKSVPDFAVLVDNPAHIVGYFGGQR